MFKVRASTCLSSLTILAIALSVPTAFAQRGGGTGGGAGSTGGAGGGIGAGGSTGRGNTGINNNTITPNSPIYSPSTNSDINRPIFLSGRVILDDGAKPTKDIAIQRVCNGSPHTESYVDSRGHFSFQVGASGETLMDASESSVGSAVTGRPYSDPSSRSGLGGTMRGDMSSYLQRCYLQAHYPGYRSDMIDLFQRRALDNPNVGVIVLHRIGGIQGTAISLTTEMAPKKAKKAYQKSQELITKGKLDEAKDQLQAAVDEYPKYAIAWYDLGRLDESQKNNADARKAFETAVAADSKYVNPIDALAGLDLMESKWQDAADKSKQVVSLNPVEFPSAWLYNAYANYHLKNFGAAEKSAKEVLKLDGSHKYAQIETLLAQLNVERGDYAAAAQHLETYLQLQPNAPNAAQLKEQLAKLQDVAAQNKK